MIKMALAAAQHINRNIPYNLAQLGRFMRRAWQAGAQLVCFGETFSRDLTVLTGPMNPIGIWHSQRRPIAPVRARS